MRLELRNYFCLEFVCDMPFYFFPNIVDSLVTNFVEHLKLMLSPPHLLLPIFFCTRGDQSYCCRSAPGADAIHDALRPPSQHAHMGIVQDARIRRGLGGGGVHPAGRGLVGVSTAKKRPRSLYATRLSGLQDLGLVHALILAHGRLHQPGRPPFEKRAVQTGHRVGDHRLVVWVRIRAAQNVCQSRGADVPPHTLHWRVE